VVLVAKWNSDIERRKDSQYGYADQAWLTQFSPHIGAAILALRVLAKRNESRRRSSRDSAESCGAPTTLLGTFSQAVG
jgi:hypothetical protein